MNWAPQKRLFRFPPSFHQNLVVLVASLTGIIVLVAWEGFQGGLTLRLGMAVALLSALAAATGMLIYQERKSRALLRDLRQALGKIAPGYPQLAQIGPPAHSMATLEDEIHSLTNNWREFCKQCQRVQDVEMVQTEDLSSLGELATGIAHEIRNPLAGIAGTIEIITKDFPKEHPDREILEDLRQEVRRIEKVLKDFLTYARPKPPQYGMADLKETVAHTLEFARQQIGSKNIEFSVQIPPSMPRFRMDPEQLQQVLLNLILNGVQSVPNEGKITLQAHISRGLGGHGPGNVEISVTDTGVGISPEQMEKIFRPFYTTKRDGTGLGLSLCRRIITQHGGTLTAESEIKKGSRFIIRLPLREFVDKAQAVGAAG